MNVLTKNLLLTCLIAASYGLSGCGQNATPPREVAKTDQDVHGHKHGDHGHSHDKDSHEHADWWCAEHDVPEAECGLCNDAVRMAMKKKGDWCKEHDRPDSQCFLCHPEKLDEYAARYEAKYGKKPPKPELN